MSPPPPAALDRARRKAYRRLLPLLFVCYVVAYIDRVNVGFAKLEMQQDLKRQGFSETVFGVGMGIFFVGYLLLEIPGTLLVERWSARKWLGRILVTWGFVAALTAFVRTPAQFYGVRFLLGLAEAGFFPGVIVFLTHWFPRRDRTQALAWFFIGTPIAQIIGPPVSGGLMAIGERGNPALLGLVGWQWVYIVWGIPAVVLGLVVLASLPDRPRQASWLSDEERAALEEELARERRAQEALAGRRTIGRALADPRVLALAAAYFFVVTGNYGVELYMASIFEDWYGLDVAAVAALVVIPPLGSLIGQVFIGWNSDRTNERRWHATLPILLGAAALALAPLSQGTLWLTVLLFTVAMTGLKAFLPAFWALPSLLMTEAAAAASIGLINSFGNLGGAVGPTVLGVVKQTTDSYRLGLWFLAASMAVSATIIVGLGIGRRAVAKSPGAADPLAEPVIAAAEAPVPVLSEPILPTGR
jgi:MFS transporter, ACS family, tartrate transporter